MRKKTPDAIPILISGLIGSGKSTLAKNIAQHFNRNYISASIIRREFVLKKMGKDEKKVKQVKEGFWETEDGRKGLEILAKNPHLDKKVDILLVQTLKKNPHSVSDAWLMPWLYKGKAIRIWLTASEKERAERVAERGKLAVKNALASTRERMKSDQKIFWNLYKIKLGNDLDQYDLILNNEGFTLEQTFQVVKTFLDARFFLEK